MKYSASVCFSQAAEHSTMPFSDPGNNSFDGFCRFNLRFLWGETDPGNPDPIAHCAQIISDYANRSRIVHKDCPCIVLLCKMRQNRMSINGAEPQRVNRSEIISASIVKLLSNGNGRKWKKLEVSIMFLIDRLPTWQYSTSGLCTLYARRTLRSFATPSAWGVS